MIECMRTQLKNQVKAFENLAQFTINQTGLSNEYNQLMKDIHEATAKVSMTVEMVKKEMALFGDAASESELPRLLAQLVEKEGEVGSITAL